MWTVLAKAVRGLAFALVGIGAVFVLGMRRKSPVVLNAVRRLSRATKGGALKTAGTAGASASVLRHVGRRTGRPYETPVRAVATADGFVIALPYGANTDWLKNVLASGEATVVNDGRAYAVDRPQVIPLAQEAAAFTAGNRRAHRVFGVTDGLKLRLVEPDPGQAPGAVSQSGATGNR
jgi:deazaflavin-dependent oxidoreductase (nitroreductase family)